MVHNRTATFEAERERAHEETIALPGCGGLQMEEAGEPAAYKHYHNRAKKTGSC